MAGHVMETLKQCLMRRIRRDTSDSIEDRLQVVPTCESPSPQKPDHSSPAQPGGGKPDGGYGWVVVLASFLAHVTIYGVSWSVGMFNIMFLESFQQSKSATAWVGSLLNASMFVSGLLSSALVSRYGCRPVVIAGGILASTGLALAALAQELYVVYITFSGLGGVGLGLAYVPAIVSVSEYFERRRTIALGLAVSGVGFGCFVFPPIIRALMEMFSWRLVLVIIAVIVVCNLTVAGAMMAPLKQTHAPAKNGGYFTELRECLGVMKTVPMLVLSMNHFLFCFGQVIVYVHLGAFAVSSGLLTRSGTATLFSIIGVSNLVGRIVHGVVCHFPQMATILVFTASTLVTGVSTLLLAACTTVTSLSVCASVFGFASCCLGALTPDIIIGLVGEPRLAVTYGYLMLFEAAGFMLGAPFAGLLYDRTETYLPSFCTAGALLVLAALVMVVPWRYRRVQLLPGRDPESGGSDSDTDFSSVGDSPPTPVKEPAQPADFLYPPSPEDGSLDAVGGGRTAEQEGEDVCQREVDLGEAGSCYVWQGLETEQSRPLVSDNGHGEDLRHSNAQPEAAREESQLLLSGTSSDDDLECSNAQPEPDGEESRLLQSDSSSEEEDLGCSRGQEEPGCEEDRLLLPDSSSEEEDLGCSRGQEEPGCEEDRLLLPDISSEEEDLGCSRGQEEPGCEEDRLLLPDISSQEDLGCGSFPEEVAQGHCHRLGFRSSLLTDALSSDRSLVGFAVDAVPAVVANAIPVAMNV